MQFLTSSIGRKILMAITGQCMVMFIVIHLIGNSTIFGWLDGGVNAYAHHLHSLPLPIIVAFRLGLLALVCVHIWYGIQLTIENSNGRPQQYAVKWSQKATFASENMIWTGLILFAFIVYHLLHFTFQTISPETAALKHLAPLHAYMVPDVYGMMIPAFQNAFITLIYVGAMVTLFLHLSHGIQSFFQTMGWSNDRVQPALTKVGVLAALVLFLGYATVPVTVILRFLK